MLVSTVNYLRVIDCTPDAAKYNEELEDRPPKQQQETYIGLPIHQLNKPLKMTIALALMSSLQVLRATELKQSIRAIIL